MPKPDLQTVPQWYHRYIFSVQEEELITAFQSHTQSLLETLEGLSEEQWAYRYAPEKWTVKEVVQHIIDAERIFCYRALCFARKESTSLPGFDEVDYAAHSKANLRSSASLLEELRVVQQSSVYLFSSLDEDQLATFGIANGSPVSVNAIGFVLIGHTLHHLAILKERYLALPNLSASVH